MVFTLFLESEYTSHFSRFQVVMEQKNLCALLFACDPILNVYKEIKEENI